MAFLSFFEENIFTTLQPLTNLFRLLQGFQRGVHRSKYCCKILMACHWNASSLSDFQAFRRGVTASGAMAVEKTIFRMHSLCEKSVIKYLWCNIFRRCSYNNFYNVQFRKHKKSCCYFFIQWRIMAQTWKKANYMISGKKEKGIFMIKIFLWGSLQLTSKEIWIKASNFWEIVGIRSCCSNW